MSLIVDSLNIDILSLLSQEGNNDNVVVFRESDTVLSSDLGEILMETIDGIGLCCWKDE